MSDFLTNGADELPPPGDDGSIRPASTWTVGDTYDIHECLMDVRTNLVTETWSEIPTP